MRAIDADKLLRDIEKYHVSDGKFQHWVQIQQTIEPKIIRCKDCKHHHRDNSGVYYCGIKDYGYGWGLNDFCSNAERREE